MQLLREDYYVGRRKRRGAVLPLFMSTVVLVAGVVVFLFLRPTIRGTVADAYTGQPLGGIALTLGDQQTKTDGRGGFTLSQVKSPTTLTLHPSAGYAGSEQEIPPGRLPPLAIPLRPTVLSGTVVLRSSDAPLPGITIRAANGAGLSSPEVATDEAGQYRLTEVPEEARLIVEGPGFARKEIEIGHRTVLDLELRQDILTGTVRAVGGAPLPNATVVMGGVTTTSKADGTYTLSGIPDEPRVVVRALGYAQQEQELGDALVQDFALDLLVVKGIYLTPDAIIGDEKFNALLALADRTEINAMVIDFKDEAGWVYHDSKVALAREIGAVHPRYDLQKRLKTLKDHDIYTIARIVCMEDPTLAGARPDLAVRNSKTGGAWKTSNGVGWVNAMRPEVWSYNIELAAEAARLGFQEIQYDYVRFPSDGDLDAIDVGTAYTPAARSDAIRDFLAATRQALAPSGVPLAIDIFGIALWDPGDNGIGQQLEKIAPVVDYICPMIYPSHFFRGSLGFDIPNDHPYEIILQSLEMGGDRVQNARLKFRPWLQDFSYGRGIAYGPNEIRAQAQATYDFGATGWMLWNANTTYTEGGLTAKGR